MAPTAVSGLVGQVPEIRVGWSKTLRDGLVHLPAATKKRIEDDLPEEVAQTLERSMSLRWIPLEVHLGLLRTVRRHVSEGAYVGFFRDCTRDSLERPNVFAKAAGAAMRWLSDDPFAAIEYMPASASIVFRGVGTYRCERLGEDALRVVQQDCPREVREEEAWFLGVQGSLLGMLETSLVRRPLHGNVERVPAGPTELRFECRVAPAP